MTQIVRRLFVLLFCCGSLLSLNVFAAINSSLAPMLQKVLPAIVNIRAQIKITDFNMLAQLQKEQKDNDISGPIPDRVLSVASGVIVDADKGYILTNAHVVNDAQSVIVTLSDGHRYPAKIVGIDKPSDVALLQIKAKNLTAITISNSSTLKVGDAVAAIGNPFGLSQTVTSGIVSALGRTTLGIESYENFIQTDAPINPGNSGGALINMEGQLVGINTAILAPGRDNGGGGSVGIGFAIPSNMAKSVMLQLIQYGDVKRGALGIAAQDVTPELATAFNLNVPKGAVISQVMLNSPAQKAGLEVGDVITAINGNEVKNGNDVVSVVAFMRVDSKAKLTIVRQNKPMTFNVTLSDPKKTKETSEATDPFLFGVSLKNFSLFSSIHGNVKGVLVVSVDEDSNAAHSDLHQGDVITSANQQKISSIEDLQKIANSAKQTLLLNVLRGPGAVYLVINREES